jgi:Fur family peroxide stress response transcriptional regulator
MEAAKLSQQQYEFLKEACERAGIKLTHQRLEIFREAVNSPDHPSVEVMYKRLKERMPTLALDTVYRTLSTLAELGVVRKLNLTGRQSFFDANLAQHHHFVCSECGRVEDIYWPEFDSSRLPGGLDKVGRIQARHLELHGLCNECLKVQEREKR